MRGRFSSLCKSKTLTDNILSEWLTLKKKQSLLTKQNSTESHLFSHDSGIGGKGFILYNPLTIKQPRCRLWPEFKLLSYKKNAKNLNLKWLLLVLLPDTWQWFMQISKKSTFKLWFQSISTHNDSAIISSQ